MKDIWTTMITGEYVTTRKAFAKYGKLPCGKQTHLDLLTKELFLNGDIAYWYGQTQCGKKAIVLNETS